MTERLIAGDASVDIDHQNGGRLSSLHVGGHELLRSRPPGASPTSWGCFPMVPWAGRIRNGRFSHDGRPVDLPLGMPPHAIHGTTHLRPWSRTRPGHLETDLGPDWPWSGLAEQTVDLHDDRLELTITVRNASEVPMPVTAGWHPWFRRTVGRVDVAVENPARQMWRRGPDGVPDGSLVAPPLGPWDDCFTDLARPVVLRWPGVLTVTVESTCPHVVIYDEEADAVCVEPQSAPPDAHNSGRDLTLVAPDGDWSIGTTWSWQPDDG